MTDEIRAIGERIHGLRDVLNLSLDSLASDCGLTAEELDAYEKGQRDIPVGVLHTIARQCNVELNTLLTGEEPHLRSYCLTYRDAGVTVDRRLDYQYKSLAYTFADRKAEPFLVTVEPKPENTEIHLNSHAGQEFDYILSGSLLIRLGEREFILNEGDSLYFNSNIPHGMRALDGKAARFLACIF